TGLTGDPTSFDLSDKGVTFDLKGRSAEGETPIASARIVVVARIDSAAPQTAGTKLTPIASVINEFEMHLEGEAAPDPEGPAQSFLLRNKFRAPFGWQAIEVYSAFNADTWNPDLASNWAESDLLAAVVRRNLQESHFTSLDPHVAARQRMIELLR